MLAEGFRGNIICESNISVCNEAAPYAVAVDRRPPTKLGTVSCRDRAEVGHCEKYLYLNQDVHGSNANVHLLVLGG